MQIAIRMDSSKPFIELKLRGRRRQASTYSDQSPRPRGRPLKRASELVASRKKAKFLQQQHQATLPNTTAKTTLCKYKSNMSPLERLPVEILEQIFLHCLEVNMVTASPFVSKMLSNESIYTLLMLFAFFDDDGIHPVETKHFKPATYRRLHIEDKIRLQVSILSCRWCNITRVTDCIPVLCRLKMVQEWHKNYDAEEPWRTMNPPPVWEQHMTSFPSAQLPELDDNTALLSYFSAKLGLSQSWPEKTPAGYMPRLRAYRSGLTRSGKKYKIIARDGVGACPPTLAVRHIPPWLLAGKPWTEEKLKFLYLLRQGHRWLQADVVLSLSAEALFAGMKSAVLEHNIQALTALLELHYAAFRVNRSTVDDPSTLPGHRFGVSFSHPIPLNLFHLACAQGAPINLALLALLIREGIDSIPKDDQALTRWAVRETRSAQPSSVATWLLKHMEGTQEYAPGRLDSPFFFNGSLGHSLSVEGFPFPNTSFTKQVGYEYAGSLNFIPQLWVSEL